MKRLIIILAIIAATAGLIYPQSAPAPGRTISYGMPIGWNPGPGFHHSSAPAPGNTIYSPGYTYGYGWGGNSLMWGAPSNVVWNPDWQNSGEANVMACGYDDQGVWRVIPMTVSYQFNGALYNVTVENAWDPWTESWNDDIDMPAYNTTYYINGNTYHFYAPLTTGTYYFNL